MPYLDTASGISMTAIPDQTMMIEVMVHIATANKDGTFMEGSLFTGQFEACPDRALCSDLLRVCHYAFDGMQTSAVSWKACRWQATHDIDDADFFLRATM